MNAAWTAEPPSLEDSPELYEGALARRVLAFCIDGVLVVAVLLGFGAAATIAGILTFGILSPALAAFYALIPLAYHIVTLGGDRSATLGMRLCGLRAVRIDGRPPSYLRAALWTGLFYLCTGLTVLLVLGIALFNDRGRTVHDYLCGMLVVNTAARATRLRYRSRSTRTEHRSL